MRDRYRVNSFVPPDFVGLDRIYYVERKTWTGWKEVEGVRGKTAEEAMSNLTRSMMASEPVEFSFNDSVR